MCRLLFVVSASTRSHIRNSKHEIDVAQSGRQPTIDAEAEAAECGRLDLGVGAQANDDDERSRRGSVPGLQPS